MGHAHLFTTPVLILSVRSASLSTTGGGTSTGAFSVSTGAVSDASAISQSRQNRKSNFKFFKKKVVLCSYVLEIREAMGNVTFGGGKAAPIGASVFVGCSLVVYCVQ